MGLGVSLWVTLFVVALEIPAPRGFARARYGVNAAMVRERGLGSAKESFIAGDAEAWGRS